jgi:predicted amidophosphoribosyltransferase
MAVGKKPNPKKVCPNCGRKMVQQFIGLKHCKCGTSWQKGVGYFERTPNMVFCLRHKVVMKGKNAIKTKQAPTIRYKAETEQGIKNDA